jgi:UDP-glucose:(heptosyl)LPS alpha-1,3-glucosyltransferase
MSKRIAIIMERADIALGGAERSVLELAAALSALGPKVDILAAKGQRQSDNVHILCRDTAGKRVGYAAFTNVLRKYLAENHYDIVHSVLPFDFAHIYQPRGGTYIESIRRNTASYQSKPVEAFKKLTAFANVRRTILLRAERRLCEQADGPTIVAISQYVAEQFRQHYAVPDRRLVVVPSGIRPFAQVDPAKADRLRAQIMTQLNIKEADQAVFFLFVANNFRLKGLAALIKAMHLVAGRRMARPAFAIITGRGKPHKYSRLAKKLNIHNKMIFLGSIQRIQDILSISDVGVLPTFYDPCSRFILEALAAGKPVITTSFNGATDLFVKDRHGKVIDNPEDTAALAEAITHFTGTNNIEEATQAIAADNLKEKISVNRVAKQLLSVYESISQRKG